jgi:hypothetical protein
MKEKISTFVDGFLNGMTNERGGHSMKKWLAVGFFWLIFCLCMKFTDASNLSIIVGILIGAVLTLMGINQLGKQTMKKLDQDEPSVDKPDDAK